MQGANQDRVGSARPLRQSQCPCWSRKGRAVEAAAGVRTPYMEAPQHAVSLARMLSQGQRGWHTGQLSLSVLGHSAHAVHPDGAACVPPDCGEAEAGPQPLPRYVERRHAGTTRVLLRTWGDAVGSRSLPPSSKERKPKEIRLAQSRASLTSRRTSFFRDVCDSHAQHLNQWKLSIFGKYLNLSKF